MPYITEEVHQAEVIRSFDTLIREWTDNDDISANDMCNQLDELMSIIDDDITFTTFMENTGISGKPLIH